MPPTHPTVIAQPATSTTWRAWCPAYRCGGLIGTDGDWEPDWTEADFRIERPWTLGICIECGRYVRVRRGGV